MTSTAAPAFIVGCGRSGTTLLRAMLDSHPLLAVPPESYFTVSLLKQRDTFEPAGRFQRTAFLDELTRLPSFQEWQLDRDQLGAWEPFASASTVPEALAAAYGCYASTKGKTRSVDKTPFQGPNVDLLARSFPEARFIHLIRDGRNVAQSLSSMDFGPDTLDGAILEWQLHVEAIDRYDCQHPGDVLAVRYEDLVEDTASVLTGICNHLGIEFSEEMLSYPDRAGQVLDGIAETAHLEGVRRPPTRDRRDWRTAVPPEKLVLLEGLAGNALARHGYQLVADDASPLDRLKIQKSRLTYWLRGVRLGFGARRARFVRARRVRTTKTPVQSGADR